MVHEVGLIGEKQTYPQPWLADIGRPANQSGQAALRGDLVVLRHRHGLSVPFLRGRLRAIDRGPAPALGPSGSGGFLSDPLRQHGCATPGVVVR